MYSLLYLRVHWHTAAQTTSHQNASKERLRNVTDMNECSGTCRWLHKHCLHLMVKVHEGGGPLQLISGPGHLWTKQSISTDSNMYFTNHTQTLCIIECTCMHPGAQINQGYEKVVVSVDEVQHNTVKAWRYSKVTDLWIRPWFPGCKRRAIGAPSASAARSRGTGWCKGRSRPPAFPAADPGESGRAC